MVKHSDEFKRARAEARKATQFGGERANPRRQDIPDAPAPWSIRNSFRRICAADIDPHDKNSFHKVLGKKITVAQAIAAAIVYKAIGGDIGAAKEVMDNVDGKLPEHFTHTGVMINVNAELTEEESEECHADIMSYAMKYLPKP